MSDVIKMVGVVSGINRGGMFNVDMTVGDPPQTNSVLARLSGKMRKYQIKIVVGDAVEIEFSPYDLTLGRITRRNR